MSREGVHAAWDHLPHLTASVAVLAGDHFFLHEDTTRGAELIEEHLA